MLYIIDVTKCSNPKTEPGMLPSKIPPMVSLSARVNLVDLATFLRYIRTKGRDYTTRSELIGAAVTFAARLVNEVGVTKGLAFSEDIREEALNYLALCGVYGKGSLRKGKRELLTDELASGLVDEDKPRLEAAVELGPVAPGKLEEIDRAIAEKNKK